ncbi:hypothetical protein [Streptomyces sp. NPDC058583]|uniref:hypothetical protein n=1 Tax=unclassified Streptomyces TaxID=2593676 RepID=UPI003660D032
MSRPEPQTAQTQPDGEVLATLPEDDDQAAAVARARRHVIVYLVVLAGLFGALAIGILL